MQVFRDEFLQALVERPKQRGHEQRREHLRAVVEDRQREPEDRYDRHLRAEDLDGVYAIREPREARQHDDAHDGEADPGVGADPLRRVVGDVEGEEDEDRLPAQIEEAPRRREVGARVGPVGDDTQRAHEGHEGDEQGCAEQRPEDRPERVGEELEDAVEPRELAAGPLRPGGGLDGGCVLRVGGCPAASHRWERLDVVVDVLHAAADDHLVALARLRDDAHHARDGFDRRPIDAGCVAQLEPKPGCAVREVLDVPGAAELIDDRPGWPRSARWVLWHGWTSIAGRPC